MKAHRGKVEVESTRGSGSAFTLSFPRKRPVTEALFTEAKTETT
jgi:signal transduction histidine kinase